MSNLKLDYKLNFALFTLLALDLRDELCFDWHQGVRDKSQISSTLYTVNGALSTVISLTLINLNWTVLSPVWRSLLRVTSKIQFYNNYHLFLIIVNKSNDYLFLIEKSNSISFANRSVVNVYKSIINSSCYALRTGYLWMQTDFD